MIKKAEELEKKLDRLVRKVGTGYASGDMKQEELAIHFQEYLQITCDVAEVYDEKQIKNYIMNSTHLMKKGKLPTELFGLILPIFNFRLIQLNNDKSPYVQRKPIFYSIKDFILIKKL